jgi:hypothetical protein
MAEGTVFEVIFLLALNILSLIFAVRLQRGYPNAEGSVVQLVRMPPCHGGGRGFESRPVRRSKALKFSLVLSLRVLCVGRLLDKEAFDRTP